MSPILVDIMFMPLEAFWTVWFNLPNGLMLLVYYPNKETAIDVPFWRILANFLNVDPKPILVVKTSNDFIFLFAKFLQWSYFSERKEIIFWWKGWWVGSLYLPDGSLPIIASNASLNTRTEASRIHLKFVLWVINILCKKRELTKKSPS